MKLKCTCGNKPEFTDHFLTIFMFFPDDHKRHERCIFCDRILGNGSLVMNDYIDLNSLPVNENYELIFIHSYGEPDCIMHKYDEISILYER